MEAEKLVEVLTACVQPNTTTRKEAEEIVAQQQELEGFCVSLFRILTSNQVPHAPRLLSSIILKNLVIRHWSPIQGRRSHLLHEEGGGGE
jgi:Importin-beta N-terminal domain